jgi:hypothetical protein
MSHYVRHGAPDWRVYDGARASGISYLLAKGQSGEIIDPIILRTFYTRIFYAKIKTTCGKDAQPKANL